MRPPDPAPSEAAVASRSTNAPLQSGDVSKAPTTAADVAQPPKCAYIQIHPKQAAVALTTKHSVA
jgi:hypothetical protein